MRITPRLRVSVGGRHFDYRLRETFHAIDQYSPSGRDADGFARQTPLPEEFNFGKADAEGQIYRFNASYQLDDGSLFYGTVAEGFRPGGFNLVTPNTGVPLDQRQYDPDSIVSYEVGAKLGLLDHRLYLSSAVYYIDWSDIQVSVPTTLGFTIFGNAGKASSRGFELEMQSRNLVADGLTLGLSYSFVDAKLEETINNLGFSGERVPRVPQHSGSVFADYSWTTRWEWQPGLTLQANYTGDSFTAFGSLIPDIDNGEPVENPLYVRHEEYWLMNLSARLENDAWTVRLFVDNLLNNRVDLSHLVQLAGTELRGPFLLTSVNRPRTIGLSLTPRF